MHTETAVAEKKDTITLVAPNGAERTEQYHPSQKVGHVLDHAVKEFGKEGNLDPKLSYLLVLGSTPLEEGLTLGEAGVTPGSKLKVRAKEIPGDGGCIRN